MEKPRTAGAEAQRNTGDKRTSKAPQSHRGHSAVGQVRNDRRTRVTGQGDLDHREGCSKPLGRGSTRGRSQTAVGGARRAGRSGKGHAARPAPYSPGPAAPSIRPPGGSERRRRRRLSRGGHSRGGGKGKHPGTRARRGTVPPLGGAVGCGERAWRGRYGAGAATSPAREGLGLSRGRSGLPGVGWRGRPGPQPPQHKQAPDAEPPGSAGGGGRAAW